MLKANAWKDVLRGSTTTALLSCLVFGALMVLRVEKGPEAFLGKPAAVAETFPQRPEASFGIRLEANNGIVADGMRRFLYEAARSGSFGVVETTERYQQGSPAGLQWHVRHLRFDYFANLARCSSMPTGTHPSGHPAADLREQVIRHWLFLEDLASGRCVVATEIDRPAARYALKPDGTLIDGDTGATVGRLGLPQHGAKDVEHRLWAAFGQVRVNATRFDDADEKERPENVPDAVLARTLTHGNDALKQAAARIIGERLQVSRRFVSRATMGGYGPRLHEIRPTGAELGHALVESGLLRSSDVETRAAALRAAAAIPSAREWLMPVVMQAMADVIVPRPLDAKERLLSGRLDNVLPGTGNGLFRDTTPKPGSEFGAVVDAAALAAARFGPAFAELLVARYEADIVAALRGLTGAQGIALAVAAAPSGMRVVDRALPIVDRYGDGYVLWNVAAMLAARPGPPSAEVMDIVRSRCDTPTFGANRRFDALFCDSMTAWSGDQAALDRIARVVVEGGPKAAGDIVPPAEKAAYALLFDVGPAGVERLRSIAETADPAAASIALGALCHLGPDAGSAAIARAQLLAGATTDGVMRSRHAMCSASKRSDIGRLAKIQ